MICSECKGYDFSYTYEGTTPVCINCGLVDSIEYVKPKKSK